jgi:hypothetical protein
MHYSLVSAVVSGQGRGVFLVKIHLGNETMAKSEVRLPNKRPGR